MIATLPVNKVQQLKASITSERWQEFHENTRVLIVDDNHRSAEILFRKLIQLYGQVDLCTSPESVNARIEHARLYGKPYDVVVLDLYMPKKTGMEVLKDLPKESTPAVVIHTASMMSSAVADLSYQLDDYRSGNTASIIASLEKQADKRNLGLAPIVFSNKLDDLSVIINKIDLAIFINKNSDNGMAEFIDRVKPKLIPVSVPSEVAHRFAEEIRNLVQQIEPIISYLIVECDLAKTPWWKRESAEILKSIEYLSSRTYSRLWNQSPKEIDIRLHDAIQPLFLLSAPDPQDFSPEYLCHPVRVKLSEWRDIHQESSETINNIRKDLQHELDETLDFNALCKKIGCEGVYDRQDSCSGNFLLADKEHEIKNLILEIGKIFSQLNKHYSVHSPWMQIEFQSEISKEYDSNAVQKRCDDINCGTYYKVTFSAANCDASSLLRPIIGRLSEFQKDKKGFFIFEESKVKEGSFLFNLYIKASDQTINLQAYLADKYAKKPDGSYLMKIRSQTLHVQESLGIARDIVVLRDEHVDLSSFYGSMMYYEVPGKKIIAYAAENHYTAAIKIFNYLNQTKQDGFIENSITPRKHFIDEIYHEGVRGRMNALRNYGIEGGDPQFTQALIELGIDRKTIDSRHFEDRPDRY